MKIGIDCRTLSSVSAEHAGVAHYTRYLVSSLLKLDRSNSYVLFCNDGKAVAEFRRRNVKTVAVPVPHRIPLLSSHWAFARALDAERLDLFHAPTPSLPLTYGGKCIVTVHDCFIYDHPEWFPSGQTFSTRIVVPRSVKRAHHVIAVSEATKKEVVDRFRIPEARLAVIPEGVMVRKVRGARDKKPTRISERYLLFIGTLEPRKNLELLIDAFDFLYSSSKSFRDLHLVIAGGRGWKHERILKKIIHAKAGPNIRYIGYVSHNEKIDLFKEATAFVFPSLNEGFGLPVLEAMALGVPVIAGNRGALPEIVGRSGVLVNPLKSKEIAAAMKKIVNSPRLQRELRAKGKRKAARYTWERTAKKTLEVYKASVSS